MNQVELFEDRVIGDIAKGRFPKAKVREIIEELCRIKGLDISRRVFEYSWLFALQTLHYEFGFGAKRLERFWSECAKAVDGFDAGAFTIEDMRQVIKEDAKFDPIINWGDKK